MLRFLADEDFSFDIVRGVRRRAVELGLSLDVLTALDAGLATKPDPQLLEWAAANSRVVLTRDVNTLVGFAYERVKRGMPTPGVLTTSDDAPIGRVIEDLLMLSECSDPGEWEGVVAYLPLK